MGRLIALAVVILLAVLPLGVRVRYDEGGILLRVIAGPVKVTVFPRPKKKKKEKTKKEPKQAVTQPGTPAQPEEPLPEPPKPPKQEKADAPKEKKGGKLTDFLPFVHLALDFLGDFRRKLRLNDLYLKLVLASSDPCDLAVNYGRTWVAVGNLMPQLEKWFVIKKRDVEVACDFTASETLVTVRLDVTITLGRLLSLVAVYGVRALKEFLHFQKIRKGGAAS